MIEGKRTVMRGIDKIKCVGLRFKSDNRSFALNMIIRDIMRRTHSRAILVKLSIPMPKPYISRDTGHNNCVPPVRKSLMMLAGLPLQNKVQPFFLYQKHWNKEGTKNYHRMKRIRDVPN